MNSDPVRGKTLRWTFGDGVMAGKTYEHAFGTDGTVTWTDADQKGGQRRPGDDSTAKYEVERVNDDVFVVSYLGKSGYALTTVVDSKTGKIVSFASNEKSLYVQHGRSEEATAA